MLNQKKLIILDTETTGIDPVNSALIELAGIIVVEGKTHQKFQYFIRPHATADISDEALAVNGKTLTEINEYPMSHIGAHMEFTLLLSEYVNKFDPADKFTPVAYNGNFDLDFINSLFKRCGDNYFGSYIDRRLLLDPLYLARYMHYAGPIDDLKNLKLSTLYEYLFNRPLVGAHGALSDAYATFEILQFFTDVIRCS